MYLTRENESSVSVRDKWVIVAEADQVANLFSSFVSRYLE